MNEENKTDDCDLTVSALLDAPQELVWDVWTNPEHIKNWWGPDGFTNSIDTMDMTEGGVWEFVMHGPDGTDYRNRSIFREVVKPRRIVFEHVTGPKYFATVEFSEEGEGTRLEWRMRFESKEKLEQTVKTFKADDGLKQNIEKLVVYLQKNNIGNQPIVVEARFNAPVSSIWKALTDEDEMRKWYFDLPGFVPEKGFEFNFSGGPSSEKQYLHLCKITDVLPEKRLTYSWRYDGYAGNSFVTFELENENDDTRFKLTHAGIETFPADNADLERKNFVEGWN